MSETLAWEKWSTFSHNRYLEEAEKSSKPGSVAKMKAYFEAHYKKIGAKKEAVMEQPNDDSKYVESEVDDTHNMELVSSLSSPTPCPSATSNANEKRRRSRQLMLLTRRPRSQRRGVAQRATSLCGSRCGDAMRCLSPSLGWPSLS